MICQSCLASKASLKASMSLKPSLPFPLTSDNFLQLIQCIFLSCWLLLHQKFPIHLLSPFRQFKTGHMPKSLTLSGLPSLLSSAFCFSILLVCLSLSSWCNQILGSLIILLPLVVPSTCHYCFLHASKFLTDCFPDMYWGIPTEIHSWFFKIYQLSWCIWVFL